MDGVNSLIRETLKEGKEVNLQDIYQMVLEKGEISKSNKEMISEIKAQIRSSLWTMIKENKIIRVRQAVYKKRGDSK